MTQKKKDSLDSSEQSLFNIITMLKDEVVKLIKNVGKLERRVRALEENQQGGR